MRLNQLRHLLAIMDAGSVRGAARKLDLTAPVLSRSVRELEAELGAQLMERTTHGIVPTRAGRALITRARSIQSELTRIKEETAQIAGGTERITFGVGWPGFPLLKSVIAAFRRKHPATGMFISGGTNEILLPQLRAGQLDFVIDLISPNFRDKSIRAVPLWRETRVLVCRPGHPQRNAKTWEEIKNAEFLTIGAFAGRVPGFYGDWLQQEFEVRGLPAPNVAIRCNATGVYLQLIAETDMIGATSLQRAQTAVAQNLIQVMNIKIQKPLSHAVYLYHRADSALTPAAAMMVAAVKAEARKLAFSKNAR